MAQAAPKPEQLQAIGNVTVQFSLLENCIILLIHQLLNEEHRVKHIITANLSFARLLELLRYLGFHRRADFKDKFQPLIKHASQAEKKRNQITHSIWSLGSQKANHLLCAKRDLKRNIHSDPNTIWHLWGWRIEEIDTRGINSIAEFIAEVQLEAFKLLWELQGMSSRGKEP